METEKLETEDKAEDVFEDNEEIAAEANLEVAQLQGLVAELREGLHAALTELCMLRQRDHGLEEKLQAHQTDVDDKIMSLKNSLNTFKEELSVAMFHIKDVTDRQREVFKHTYLHPSENGKEIVGVPKRKGSKADVLKASGDEHICVPSHSDLSILQHYFSSLPQSGSPQRSTTSTQTSNSEREALEQQQRDCPAKPSPWGERKFSRDEIETPSSLIETNKRQRAALELLESERVYVSHLSLLLKANISFNGSEALTSQDKRPFPSSLRFLIQQHLELLHTLQERVLKCQWQGIMGDIFMRLTSKESDFLDLYASYLKELPDCLSVINILISSANKPSTFLESDIMGDGSKPSLHSLLLQPVQRIPEYMLQLQGLLRHTEAEHPDYYLLLVSVQQFRSFSTQYHHLLQHNQELLLHNRKEVNRSTMKQLLNMVENGIQANNLGSVYACSSATLEHANQVKQSKQRLLEQIQSHRFRDWDRTQDPESHCYEAEWPAHLPLFSPDGDSRNPRPTGLGSIPESEMAERSVSCQHHLPSRQAEFRQAQPGSALADALEEFLLPPDPPGMESLYEEDRSSLPDVSMFDRCSSASSDSSIDIAFVKCPKAPLTPQHAMATNISTSRDVFVGRPGNGYSKMTNRGCVSPDEAVMMRRNLHRPLQASQRKSKSLNGLQMDHTVSDCGPMSDRGGLGSHAKLERQGSKGSRGCSTPSRKLHSPLGNRMDMDKQGDDLHAMLSMPHQDLGIQSWGDETKWRVATEENNHSAFSERSRKQDKGGFRSSFKKLFKKKNGEEKKEKAGEKVQENESCGEPEKNPKMVNVEINRGTAV